MYGSKHGGVLEGAHSVKISHQQDFCIRLEQITNGFEGLVLQGVPPAWKDLGTHKTGSFFENTLSRLTKGSGLLLKNGFY